MFFGLEMSGNNIPVWMKLVFNVFYCAGYSSDAVFYIFYVRKIRKTLRLKLRNFRRILCCERVEGTRRFRSATSTLLQTIDRH